MHVPLLHRNAPLWQETVKIIESIMFRYKLVTLNIVEKLTAVPLITSVRASPSPSIASKGGGGTLAIATLKLSGTALTYIDVKF